MNSESELLDILNEEKFNYLRNILGEMNQSQMGIMMNGLLNSTKQIHETANPEKLRR